jgi:TRAP-type C4-dicarboxylate transport system permease small subunit
MSKPASPSLPFVSGIVNGGLGIGVIFMLGVMLVVVANIVSRLLGRPILGTLEIASLCLVPTIAFAIAYTGLTQSHIVVDILTSRLKKRRTLSTALSFLTALLSLVFWALMAWKSTDFAAGQWTIREATEVLKLPVSLFRWVWAAGLWIFVLVLCADVIRILKKRTDR